MNAIRITLIFTSYHKAYNIKAIISTNLIFLENYLNHHKYRVIIHSKEGGIWEDVQDAALRLSKRSIATHTNAMNAAMLSETLMI